MALSTCSSSPLITEILAGDAPANIMAKQEDSTVKDTNPLKKIKEARTANKDNYPIYRFFSETHY
jgi:hypothetical protein